MTERNPKFSTKTIGLLYRSNERNVFTLTSQIVIVHKSVLIYFIFLLNEKTENIYHSSESCYIVTSYVMYNNPRVVT